MTIFEYIIGITVGIIFTLVLVSYFIPIDYTDSLTFVSQYTVHNYSTNDGVFKVFLLAKERLNQSILLTNDNDITDKILITKLPYY
jgi:hypothetical protein